MPEPSTGAFDGLPDATFALVPELRRLPMTGEARASCSDCVMAPARMSDVARQFAFVADVRCCTYHPDLPNYLVGRALRRGDAGAELMRARLREASGVSPRGIEPDDTWRERRARSARAFGRDSSLRCPFWVAGDVGCGIWRDRNAICRAWFCRYEHGPVSRRRWHAAREAVSLVEVALALWCVKLGDPPPDEAPLDTWERWYCWCADAVDALTPESLVEIASAAESRLGPRRDELAYLIGEPTPALPDVVIAEIGELVGDERGLAVCGYSQHDPIDCPLELLDFVDLLDGERTWQQAAREAGLDEALIPSLYQIGVLRAPVLPRPTTTPALLIPALRRPLRIGDRVVLRGESLRGCAVAHASIFELITKLDGTQPWRPILGDVPVSLVDRLHHIGALVEP